jgi:[protein-PII] uridylyltransferase
VTTRSDAPVAEIGPAWRGLVADRALGGLGFGAAASDLIDDWLIGLLGDEPGVVLLAVGAHGRRELCPASDLDLVLIHDGRRGRDLGALADRLWYPIWDSGFRLDHSVRTPNQARAIADDDLKAALGLLDARVVAGDHAVGDKLVDRLASEWQDRARRRLPALDALVQERHRAAGDVAHSLEPDLKEGRGGSRDVAIVRALSMLSTVVTVDERMTAAKSQLFEARVALQRVAGSTDRLLLEHQDSVAAELGLRDADELMTRVSSAARTIAAQSEEAWRAVRAWLQGPRGRSAAGGDLPLSRGVVLRDGEVALVADASPTDDPALVLRAAADAAYLGASIARPTLRRFDDEVRPVPGPWSDETRDAFVALLGGGEAMVPLVELLDEHGLFVHYLPEWDRVRCKPQRNAFHRFTVDRHLLETVARADDALRSVRRPDLLLVGALLHDLGKGGPGDHTDNGVALARTVATRMGFPADDVAVLVDLVRHHLLLPSFATGRDLDDPATIDAVAEAVGDEETLDLLAALTVADSIATGPTAWSEWKATLVQHLVARVRDELRRRGGAESDVGATEPASRRDPLLDRFDGTLTVEPRPGAVTFVAPDALGLLAVEVTVLAVHAQSVRRARTFTVDRVAIGEFEVEPERGREPEWDRIADDLRAAMVDPGPIRERLAARRTRYDTFARPTAARPADPRVFVDNDATTAATLLEVRAADGVGVLARITDAIAGCGVRVEQAYVSTLGHEVVDTFYVTTPDGSKVTDPRVLTGLEDALLTALTPAAEESSGSGHADDQLR